MNRRPFVTATVAVAALVLGASAGSAGAATVVAPAVGSAVSSLSLLQLSAAGHTVRLADVNLVSDTVSDGVTSTIELIPVTADGTKIGRQVLTPADGTQTIGAVSTPGALAAIASVTSPAIEAAATGTPSARIGTTSLGSVTLFGLPISMLGTIAADSGVTAGSGAASQKTVTLSNLALPSIADLFAKLGLDLSALPVDTLNDLLDQLDLVTGAITTAQGAVDDAQAQVDAAVADLATQTAALTAAQGVLTTATATLAAATTTVTGLLATAGIADVTTYLALADPLKAAAELLAPGLAAAVQAFLDAQTAEAAAQAAVAAVQLLVDAAQALVDTVTALLDTVTATLLGLIDGVLDGTPLVSLDKLSITTIASASTAKAGGQSAKVIGGEVSGLEVLGTDVLDTVLGSSSVQLGDLVGSVLDEVNAAIDTLSGTLSSVLSSVPGLPDLEVPVPTIGLLTKSTSTSVVDGFGKAAASARALSISIPGLTIPAAVQVPGAASLPGLSAVGTAGDLVSAPVSVSLITISEQAAFRPAIVAGGTTGQTPAPELPYTGAPVGLAVLALLLVGGALALRRRFTAEV